MQTELLCRPGAAAAKVTLAKGETLLAQAGAMIAQSRDMKISTSTVQRGAQGQSLLAKAMSAAKRLLAGESLFLNTFTPGGEDGEVLLAATLPGDLMIRELHNETLMVQGGSWLACTEGVTVDAAWQGFKGFFTGESVFWVKLSGTGTVILSSFGCIYPYEIRGQAWVDTGHIVAFEESLKFKVTKPGGSWIAAILGGEGLACQFEGNGTVWCQSHNPPAFGQRLGPMLLPKEH